MLCSEIFTVNAATTSLYVEMFGWMNSGKQIIKMCFIILTQHKVPSTVK